MGTKRSNNKKGVNWTKNEGENVFKMLQNSQMAFFTDFVERLY